jgi:hypothetical protein
MKVLMILGGFLGFATGVTFGMVQESSWPSILWRSSGAALATGLLLRWWGRQWVARFHDARRERQAERMAKASKARSQTVSTASKI